MTFTSPMCPYGPFLVDEIKKKGFPEEVTPIVVGFAGYGNVSQGAQDIFDLLPVKTIQPEELINNYEQLKSERNHFIKVVFKEAHTVKSKNGKFDLKEYFIDPEKYESNFDKYIPYLDVLVNCAGIWTAGEIDATAPEKIKKVADVPVASKLSRLNRLERNVRLFHQTPFRPVMGADVREAHFGISGMNSALYSDVGDNVSGCSPSCQEYMHTKWCT